MSEIQDIDFKKVKHYLFDLGGVILPIDFQNCVASFARLGISNFEELYGQFQQSKLFDELELGTMSESQFIARIQEFASPEAAISPDQITSAWNDILLQFPAGNIQLLQDLRVSLAGHGHLALLSNTNAIHKQAFDAQARERFGLDGGIADLFDYAFFSHQLQMRKPDMEIYQQVALTTNTDLQTWLFIDDNEDNVKGAKAAGMQALHHKHNSPLEAAHFPVLTNL